MCVSSVASEAQCKGAAEGVDKLGGCGPQRAGDTGLFLGRTCYASPLRGVRMFEGWDEFCWLVGALIGLLLGAWSGGRGDLRCRDPAAEPAALARNGWDLVMFIVPRTVAE